MPTYTKSGSAVSPLVVAGPKTFVHYPRTGSATATWVSAGSDTQERGEYGIRHQWQRSFVGTGVWSDIPEATDTNYTVAAADQGCFLRVVEYDYNSAGFASQAATATVLVYIPKTGETVAPFSGQADGRWITQETGAGVAPLSGKGVRVHEYAGKTGIGVMVLTGFGPNSGSAVSVFTGHGADVSIFSKKGSATAPETGGGAKAMTFSETGSATSSLTGRGQQWL